MDMLDISSQKILHVNSSTLIYWGDTEDKEVFYLWPESPRFRRDESNNGKPVFAFYKYTQDKEGADGEMKGGYLTFDVEFCVDASTEEAAKKQIATDHQLKNVKIGTIPFTDGKVLFTTLTDKGFVQKMNTDSTPSLSGNNIATVALELTPAGSSFFYDALTGKTTAPIQVAYELHFNTILPSATAHLQYSASKAYEYSRTAKIDTHACRSGNDYSEEIYKKIIETGAGKCDVSFGAKVPAELETQVRDWAFATYKDMVQKSVFDAIDVLEKKDPKAGDKIDVHQAIQQSKDFDITYKEAQTIDYRLEPKSSLENLLNVKGTDGSSFNIDDFFKVINLDDNFFESLIVKPSVHGIDWDAMGLADLSITIGYGTGASERRRTYSFDKTGNIIVDKNNPYPFSATFEHDGNNKPIYTYNYWIEANFNNSTPSFKSGMLQSNTPTLSIGPNDLQILCINLQASNLINWNKMQAVLVDVSCQGAKLSEIEFNKDCIKRNISLPISSPPQNQKQYEYTYTITYKMAEGIYKSTNTTNQASLIIPDFANETVVYNFFADDDPTIRSILLTLEYEDTNNHYHKRIDQIDLYKQQDKSYSWTINVIDVNGGDVYYSGSIIYNDGKPIKAIPRTKAKDRNIMVYEGAPKLKIEIDPSMVDWSQYKVVMIYLEYKDVNVYEKTNLKFTPQDEMQSKTWTINVADKSHTKYSWKGTFITNDYKKFETPMVETDENPLLFTPPYSLKGCNHIEEAEYVDEEYVKQLLMEA